MLSATVVRNAAVASGNPKDLEEASAAADYILQETVSQAELDQFVVSGFVSGDTSSFFNLLMQLHQQAFKPAPDTPAQPARPAAKNAQDRPAPQRDDEPWIAPSEARESGYIESTMAPDSQAQEAGAAPGDAVAEGCAPAQPALAVGTWVDLRVEGQWERTQLSWIGPHGTLFLFTSARGRSQSMTLRLLDRLIEQGAMRIVTQQTVVEGALDAVAQAAMRNSVDVRL